MVTKDEVLEKLKTVEDPEIGINIVDLGLIYDVEVVDGKVKIEMTLTTMGCPLGNWILGKVKETVESIPGVEDVEIRLTFDPPWNPSMISEDVRKRLGIEK